MTNPSPSDFRLFYEQSAKQIYSFAFLMAGDFGEDLAAEAYSRALARWNDVSGYEHPDAWIRRVIINLLASRMRKERVHGLFLQTRRPDPTATENATQTEDRMMLREAMEELTPKQRAAILLRYWSELSLKETARAMGCSVSSASVHLRRARSKLEKILGEAYISETELGAPTPPSSEQHPQRASQPRRTG